MHHVPLIAGIAQRLAEISLAQLAIWCGLVVTSIVLVASLRIPWARRRPLFRCAMGSLLVHLVLIGLTMTVRLVVGDGGGPGSGPPIRVKLVDDVRRDGPIVAQSPAAPPLLVEPNADAANADAANADAAKEGNAIPLSDTVASPAAEAAALAIKNLPAIEPPPLLPPPEPATAANEELVVDAEQAADDEQPAQVAESEEEATSTAAPVDQPSEPVAQTPPAETLPADDIRPNDAQLAAAEAVAAEIPAAGLAALPLGTFTQVATTVAPATSPYAHRHAPDRLEYTQRHGGSVKTEAAVAAALAWLARTQSPDGRWDASRPGDSMAGLVSEHAPTSAGANADSGITALSLLAFMGAGHSHVEGDYQAEVGRGLEFLLRGQNADGHLAADANHYARMYCHSMATFALAEALAMTGDRRLEPYVRRAVDYSIRAQHPASGGWRYLPGDLGDTSQLGWQLMSLWSAEKAGIQIPGKTWTGADRFLRSVRRGRSGGLASYRPDGTASTPMTAEAFYCRQIVGEAIEATTDQAITDEAIAALLATPPEPQRVNLYYWYYGTLALYHEQDASPAAASAWQSWNSALTLALVSLQVNEGPHAGSWEPNCIWGGSGGRVYSTAIAAMCLEVYYRYTNDAAIGWTASRPEGPTTPR